MIILVRAPETPPEETPGGPTPEPRRQLALVLTGVDGSTWDLIDGPVRLQAGASGLGTVTPEHWWRDSAALDGADWLGMRTPKRELFLPVRVNASTSLGWRDVDAAFAKAIDPAGEAELRLTTPDAHSRTLPVRFSDGGQADYDVDPLLLRHAAYGLVMVAADPYWRGDAISVRYEASDPLTFFEPNGGVINIAPANTVATATVTNPGDVPASAKWILDGPFTAATVGVGDSVVTIEANVLAGEQRIIDMDRRQRTIIDEAGASAWLDATAAEFVDIPAGSSVELNLDVTGAGSGTAIELQFTPRYRRAW